MSVCFVILGIFLCLDSIITLFTGMISAITKEAQEFKFNSNEILQINARIKYLFIIELIVGGCFIVSGFGSYHKKKWALRFMAILATIILLYVLYIVLK